MRGLLVALALVSAASGQSYPPNYPYLLRLDHYAFGDHSCALLQNTGAFHLEVDHGDEVKVFEGTIDSSKLLEIQHELNSQPLVSLSPQQIEEPIVRSGRYEKLQVTVFRGDGWQDLFFRSSDSQRAFKQSLQPLVRWLDDLHKVPHRELSEDAGKNNCLPRTPIVLQKRGASMQQAVTAKTRADVLPAGQSPQTLDSAQQTSPAAAAPVTPMLRIHSLEIKSGNAVDRCVLVAQSGAFHFERRTQKNGKPVDTEISAGRFSSDELEQLRQILDDPRLAKMKHREHREGRAVPVLGNWLEVTISRPTGNQLLVLTSAFDRAEFPFYGGDGPLQSAGPLMKFVTEHAEGEQAERLSKEERNGCSESP